MKVMLDDLSMAAKHVVGAAEIVQAAGGPEALGLSNIVQFILGSCLRGHSLAGWGPVMIDCGAAFMKPKWTWTVVR